MRAANQRIDGIRYPTPAADDLMINLKDAAIFTKLDFLSAFRVNTKLLFDYNFSIRFSYQLFHTTNDWHKFFSRGIATRFERCFDWHWWYNNISDDMLNYVKNEIKQDKIIKESLKILENWGLTLIFKKCVFSQKRTPFFGQKNSRNTEKV